MFKFLTVDRLIGFALYLVLFISFASSGFGLFTMFSELSGFVSDGAIDGFSATVSAIGLSILISLAIQILVGGLWHEAMNPDRSLIARAASCLSGVGFSLVSGGLAAAFWLFALPLAGDFERMLNDRAYLDFSQPLSGFSEQFREIERGMADISAMMDEEMRVEDQKGASCDGSPVQPGIGPRYRMRERLKIEAAQQASLAVAVAEDALSATVLPATVDDSALNEAFKRARRLASDSRIFEMRNWAAATLEDFRTSFYDSQTQQEFSCRDAEVARRLDAVVALLDQPIELPDAPGRAIELGYDDALRNSYGQIWSVLGSLLGLPVEQDEAAFEATLPAFIAAALVEGAIIFLTVLRGLLSDRPPSNPFPRVGELSPDEYERTKAEVDLFTALMHQAGHAYLFYAPVDTKDVELRRRAQRAAARWDMSPMQIGGAVDISELSSKKYALIQGASGGARYFAVYRVPRKALKWLRRALVALEVPPKKGAR